ncbi:MAG: hypothetical protein WA860_12725, partial [Acidimicrobiales bacterium]
MTASSDDEHPFGVPGHIVFALNQRLERLTEVRKASKVKAFALMRNENRSARQLARRFSLDAETTERIVSWHSTNTNNLLKRFLSSRQSPEHPIAYVVPRPKSVVKRALRTRPMRHAVGWVPSWTSNRAADIQSAWLWLMD